MITLHELSNTPGARHRRKRVGRGPGSGMGKTCGRGHKGQMSRKGHKHKVGFEGGQMRLIRRLPKRGFNNFNRVEYTALNVSALNQFDDGADVTREAPHDDVVCHSVETRPGRSRSVRITASGLRRLRAEIARTQWLS